VDSLARRKAALRARMRKVREDISAEERATAVGAIEARLFDLPAMKTARAALLFSSFGSEVTTEEIVRRLQEEGRRVLLPYMEGGEIAAADMRPGDTLVATIYGPKEPAARSPADRMEVDLVVIPGLAFDRHGYRVGYGGGHYDRYLGRLGPALRVGIAFHVQLVPAVPHGTEDEPVDVVVTDQETIDCRSERGTSEGSGR